MSVKIIYNTYVEKKIKQASTKTYTPQHADTFNTKYVPQKHYGHVCSCTRFRVLTVMIMIQVFWVMMPF